MIEFWLMIWNNENLFEGIISFRFAIKKQVGKYGTLAMLNVLNCKKVLTASLYRGCIDIPIYISFSKDKIQRNILNCHGNTPHVLDILPFHYLYGLRVSTYIKEQSEHDNSCERLALGLVALNIETILVWSISFIWNKYGIKSGHFQK